MGKTPEVDGEDIWLFAVFYYTQGVFDYNEDETVEGEAVCFYVTWLIES